MSSAVGVCGAVAGLAGDGARNPGRVSERCPSPGAPSGQLDAQVLALRRRRTRERCQHGNAVSACGAGVMSS